MPKTIVIVGGGIAGLVTAYFLMKQGRAEARTFEVIILEAERTPGGQARAFEINGLTVEHGSHVFFNYYENIIKIIEELRADPDIGPSMPGFARIPGWTIVDAYGHRATLKQTPGLPVPFAVLPSILQIPWLGLCDRLRIAWGSWNLINAFPYEKFGEADQKSGYELGIEHGYSDMGILAWNSASLGLTNLFMREQSGAVFVGKHKVLINTPDGLSYQLPAGDLSELIANPLKKKLDKQGVRTRLGAEVTHLGRSPGEAKTRVTFTQDGAEETILADYVVSALRPGDAAKLLPWVQAAWKELEPVTPVLTVVLRLSGRVLQSIDDRELGLSREQWAFSVVTDLSQFWPEYAGDPTKTVLRCEIGHADRLPRGPDTPDEDVMRMVKIDLERLFPETATMTIETFAIHRETKHLYTRWVKGAWSRKPKERDVGQGVYLAGDWTTKGTIGMEAAANSGIEAANHVLVGEGLAPIPFNDVPL
ncbi:Phytoene desaturase, pro-zeta-carotene producing [Minicystis rosea]|nr:Phytoene desaturase, pro-zeta-carotene producing [Minicystis rosea]